MPTRKKSDSQLDAELITLLSNPFARFGPYSFTTAQTCTPWLEKGFPHVAALRIWKRIKHDVLEKWIKEFPGTRPWPFWVFDQGFDDDPRAAYQLEILKETKLLTEAELRILNAREGKE